MFGLAIHGGAGTLPRADMNPDRERLYRAGLAAALESGFAVLMGGGTSLDAVTRAGAHLGHVASLSNYGAGDILEIAPEGGGEALLLPFTRKVAPTIDFEGGRIVVEPPHEVDGEPSPP